MGRLDNLQSLTQKHKAVIGHWSGVCSLNNLIGMNHLICHWKGDE